MRVLHTGDIANVAFLLVGTLRKMGCDAYLLKQKGGHPRSDPHFLKGGKLPDWVISTERSPLIALKLFSEGWKSDILQAYGGAPAFCQFVPRPLISICLGSDLRQAAQTNTLLGSLLRRAYKSSRKLFYANIDHPKYLARIGLKGEYLPLPVDTSTYRPRRRQSSEGLVVFHPPSLNWAKKGNDVFIKGFQEFLSRGGRGKLYLVEHGCDMLRTRELVRNLGIEESVVFLPLLSSNKMRLFYDKADVVADQFLCGAFGCTCLEAMAMERPVLISINEEDVVREYGEMMPVLNCRTPEQICENLLLMRDEPERREIGKKARKWVVKHHDKNLVAKKLLSTYSEILK